MLKEVKKNSVCKIQAKFSSWVKKNAKFSSVENFEEIDDSAQNWNDAIQKINTEEITRLIQKLPKGCRLVFNLYAIEGHSHKEIAEQLGISVGTSKSQLHDARKNLKVALINLQTFNTSVKTIV